MEINEILEGTPFLTREQATQLVRDKFNLEVYKLKPLDGYDNQNFLIEGARRADSSAPHDPRKTTERYILKIVNSLLSKDFQSLTDATFLMHFLHKEGFSCPRLMPDIEGKLFELVSFKNLAVSDSDGILPLNTKSEDTFMVRLLTFIPGVTLDDLDVVPDHVFEESGETLGQVHKALQNLILDRKHLREWGERFVWSLNGVQKLETIIHIVEDPKRRQIVREVIDAFESEVLQKKSELPQGFIHGDYNTMNTLVSKTADRDGSETRMTGFIDFDDVQYSCVVFDVGIALMYIIQSKTPSRDTAAALFLRGYQRHRQLSQIEKSCLFHCVAGRLIQSLLLGLHHFATSRDEYVLLTQVRGWDTLEEMWRRGKDLTYQKWKFS